jgi:sucrose synthase
LTFQLTFLFPLGGMTAANIFSSFKTYCDTQQKPASFNKFSDLGRLISSVQELILENGNTCLIVRSQIARQEAYQILEDLTIVPITTQELLDLRDRIIDMEDGRLTNRSGSLALAE